MNTGKSGVGEIKFVDVPYLILTRSRSGSNLFKDYLNSHPKVKSYGKFSVQSRIKILRTSIFRRK